MGVYNPYNNQGREFATLDVNDTTASGHNGVFGGPVLAKHDLRQSQQTPSVVMKPATNKRAQGVYNSVHLPSLRG